MGLVFSFFCVLKEGGFFTSGFQQHEKGYFSFPRAFFADMRPRSTYKAWLFDTYLPMVLTKGAEKKVRCLR